MIDRNVSGNMDYCIACIHRDVPFAHEPCHPCVVGGGDEMNFEQPPIPLGELKNG